MDDSLTEDPAEIANIFNDFFINIATKLKEPGTNANHERLKEFCRSKLPGNTKFTIPSIEKQKVLKFLSGIDINKATGANNIGPRLLRLAAPHISDDIAFICNHSISVFFQANGKKQKLPLYIRMVLLKMLTTIVLYPFYLSYLKYLKNMCMNACLIF